jgi:hypothetical protein
MRLEALNKHCHGPQVRATQVTHLELALDEPFMIWVTPGGLRTPIVE